MKTVYKWSQNLPDNMPEVWNFTCRGYGWTAVPAHCRWPHTRLTHTYQSPVLPEAHYTGVSHWLNKGVQCFYPKITKKPINTFLENSIYTFKINVNKCFFFLHINVVWVYTLSVALPSMQVWTNRWPSQDTARWRMDTGRELSQGGRKQRMYWPRRTVWMITVPSWEKTGNMFNFSLQRWMLWCVLLPEIQTQPCPALCWYWRWPPRLCVHTTPELV